MPRPDRFPFFVLRELIVRGSAVEALVEFLHRSADVSVDDHLGVAQHRAESRRIGDRDGGEIADAGALFEGERLLYLCEIPVWAAVAPLAEPHAADQHRVEDVRAAFPEPARRPGRVGDGTIKKPPVVYVVPVLRRLQFLAHIGVAACFDQTGLDPSRNRVAQRRFRLGFLLWRHLAECELFEHAVPRLCGRGTGKVRPDAFEDDVALGAVCAVAVQAVIGEERPQVVWQCVRRSVRDAENEDKVGPVFHEDKNLSPDHREARADGELALE